MFMDINPVSVDGITRDNCRLNSACEYERGDENHRTILGVVLRVKDYAALCQSVSIAKSLSQAYFLCTII